MTDLSGHESLSSKKPLFERDEENLLMLEEFLAKLDARFVYLKSLSNDPKDDALKRQIDEVLERFRLYQRETAAGKTGRLPAWPEAFKVEQLLSRLMPDGEARAELALTLSKLKVIHPEAHKGIAAEWERVKAQPNAAKRLLVAAQSAVQWKNTQRWIIRKLGTIYAGRLQAAFLLSLGVAAAFVIADAFFGGALQRASLAGIGFAAAAGLLGASFSAMVGQGQVVALDNIEEARAATSRKMIALRLGVGVAAALILYFFFEAGLVGGALFPDLANIGFGHVRPVGGEVDSVRAMVKALEVSAEQLVDNLKASDTTIEEFRVSLESGTVVEADLAADLVAVSEAMAQLSAGVGEVQTESGKWHLPLGSLAPNADLSKLVVWSFAAGFAQNLVPSLLAKVEPTRQEQGGET